MFPGDVFCRSVTYPKIVKENGDKFDDDVFLLFREYDQGAIWRLSVSSLWLCRSEERVHEIGRQRAEDVNRRKSEKIAANGQSATFEPDVYLGFYSVLNCHVCRISVDGFDARLVWFPEKGDDTHCEIRLLRNTIGLNRSKGEQKTSVRIARTQLADVIFGPSIDLAQAGDPKVSGLQSRFLLMRLGRQDVILA